MTKRKAKPSPKRDARKIIRERKIIEALEYKTLGYSYSQIAEALRISQGTAHSYVMAGLTALAARQTESAAELKIMELERLDRLLASVLPDAVDTNQAAIHRESAIRSALQIHDRRVKLLGLAAPSKIAVEGEAAMPQIIYMYPEDKNA